MKHCSAKSWVWRCATLLMVLVVGGCQLTSLRMSQSWPADKGHDGFYYSKEKNLTSNLEMLKRTNVCRGCYLRGVVLRGASLTYSQIWETDLQGADLQGANLLGANLLGANLQNADLREANLQKADLRKANLHGAYLQGANLKNAKLDSDGLALAKRAGAVGLEGTVAVAPISPIGGIRPSSIIVYGSSPSAIAFKPKRKPALKPLAPPKPAVPTANTFPTKPINVRFRSSKTHPDDIAVIIGNADYKKLGKEIPNVTPAYADAEGIKRYFTKAKGVRVGNIIHLKDATGTQLVSVFGNDTDHEGQLFNWVKPNVSNVYVYYAGHGAPAGKNGSTYLVPSDASARTIRLTGFKLSTLYKNLGKIPAKSVTVILEACFSGASQGGLVLPRSSGISIEPKATLIPSNITVISAGALDQVASWEEDGKHSLFTKYFLMGMSGEGDKKPYGNGDGKVTYKELGKYLDGTMTYFARRYYGRDQKVQIVSGR